MAAKSNNTSRRGSMSSPTLHRDRGALNGDVVSMPCEDHLPSTTIPSIADAPIYSSRQSSPTPPEFEELDPCETREDDVVGWLLRDTYREDWDISADILDNAPRQPPITKLSLSELDICAVISNPKLRHDINYDRELHFRPNVDGERGRRKLDAQEQFWKAVSVELNLLYACHEHGLTLPGDMFERCTQRLYGMFGTIKDVVKNLVPEREQADVDEQLDVPLIMQEIENGACDFVSIATWMAQILKRHCAPMRDELVDRMVEEISLQHPESIARGLSDLFNVLEAMKLDVANHQIRHLRLLLIEDTINFEHKYHSARIRRGRYNIRAARRWFVTFRDGPERIPRSPGPYHNKDIEAFVQVFIKMLSLSTEKVPDTFALDADRIRTLRLEIDEIIRETICVEVLSDLVSSRTAGRSRQSIVQAFLQRLRIIVGDGKESSPWHAHLIDDIACEIMRCVLQTKNSTAHTDTAIEDAARSMLHRRFSTLDRLRGHPAPNRNPALSPTTSHYRTDVGGIEDEDVTRLCNHVANLRVSLFASTFPLVEKYLAASPCALFNALVPIPTLPASSTNPTSSQQATASAAPHAQSQNTPSQTPGPVQDSRDPKAAGSTVLPRRIAHLAILHWRIWGNLVYADGSTGAALSSCGETGRLCV